MWSIGHRLLRADDPHAECGGGRARVGGSGAVADPTRPRHRRVAAGPLRHHHRQLGHSVLPECGYLAEVIDTAMELLAPGGALFIGDVRNHGLQGAFQTGIALARGTSDDVDDIRQRVQHAMLGEPELLLAPEFFTTWAAEPESVAGVDIQVKRGQADNELSRYRYDVTIHKGPAAVRSRGRRASLGVGRICGPERVARGVGVATSGRGPGGGDPADRSDRRRPHRASVGRGAALADALAQAPPRSTRPPPNSCTASPRTVDIGSPSPGVPSPARWTQSSSSLRTTPIAQR